MSLRRRPAARDFRPHIFHLDRVHVLCDARDLQMVAFLFEVEQEYDFLGEWTVREGEVDVFLSK